MSSLFRKRCYAPFLFGLALALSVLMVVTACSNINTPTGVAAGPNSKTVSPPSQTSRPPQTVAAFTIPASKAVPVSHPGDTASLTPTSSNQTPAQPFNQPSSELSGVEWKLTAYFDKTAMRDATMQASIKFETDGTVNGRPTCGGSFWGKYQTGTKASILIEDIQIADIACPSNSAYAEDSAFMNGLKAARSYEFAAKSLTLKDPNGTILLVFTGG